MPVRLDDRTIKASVATDGRRLEFRGSLVRGLILRILLHERGGSWSEHSVDLI